MFWSCSVWKDICNFYNKIDDVFTEVSVIVRGDKAYFDCVNCSCRNKMSYELARWTHDDVWVISSRVFFIYSSLSSVLHYVINTSFVLCCAVGQFRWPACTFPRLAGDHENHYSLRSSSKITNTPFDFKFGNWKRPTRVFSLKVIWSLPRRPF